jgi:hypothetical protein
MERKQFFVFAASAGAALAATGIAAGADTNNPAGCGPAPMPRPSGGAPYPHVSHPKASEIDSAYRHVARLVETLGKDQNDYGGHRVTALGYLTQAESELQAAVAYEQAHPTVTSSPL